MQTKRAGRQTVQLSHPPSVVSFANIGGRMEGQGPLSDYFDELSPDTFFGKKTWEQGESAMQERVLRRALEKGGLTAGELDYVLAGDLLNQCIGTSFGLRSFHIPFYGLYGACSTMGESLSLAALLIDGGFARLAAAMTSSHYCTAERQYRMPVPYGSQRTPTAQWTATASGCCILGAQGDGPYITHVTCGRIVDWGGAGATVPLTGFGYSLAKGVAKAVAEKGPLGILTGGLTATSGGIAAAVVFAVLAAIFFKPKEKR